MVGGYERDLNAYFDRQKELSAAAGNAAIALLTKANEALRSLDTAKMKPLELASLFRAAAAVAAAVAAHLQASDDAVWRVLRKEGIGLQRQRSWCKTVGDCG